MIKMNEELKITNDVEYITYTLRIPKYKIVDYKFAQSNDYLQSELIHQLQQENQRLKDNWKELKEELNFWLTTFQEANNYYFASEYKAILNIMQVLEGNNE